MATYTQIGSTVTVGSGGASSIDFTSIPNTYTDLLVKLSVRVAGSANQVKIKLNGSTTNFSYIRLLGDGSGAYGGSGSDGTLSYANVNTETANTFNNAEIYIPNYNNGNYKTMSTDSVAENNGTDAISSLIGTLWSNTAAITSLSLTATSTTFVQYSSASLYGIKKD